MADWEAKAKAMRADDDDDGKDVKVLDEGDIALLQTYGLGPYSRRLTELQKTIDKMAFPSVRRLKRQLENGAFH